MNTLQEHTETPDILPAKKTLLGSAWMTAGRGIAFLASFAVVTVMGLFVPREVAGSYNYAIALLSVISITTLPGMNSALSRAVSRGYEGTAAQVIRKRVHWGSIGSLLAILIGAMSWIHGDRTLAIALFIASPFVPLTDTFSNTAFNFWQGKKRFDKSASLTVLYYFGLAVLSIPVMILSNNLLVILSVVLFAQAIMGQIAYRTIKHSASGTSDPQSLRLGMHLTAMQACAIAAGNADRIIVGILFGPAMTAVYSFASAPVSKAWQMIPFGIVSLPHLSNHPFTPHAKHHILGRAGLLFLITIPAALALALVAPFVYKIFFPLYPESVRYFQILIATLAFSPTLLLKFSFTAFHKTRELYAVELGAPIIKIILMIGLGIAAGMTGVAIGALIGTAIEFCLTTILFMFAKAT